MKIAARQLNPWIGAISKNAEQIIASCQEAKALGIDLVVFPELALTGYPVGDFLFHPQLMEDVQKALDLIQRQTQGISLIFGLPRRGENGHLFNSAAVIADGELLGFQDKTLLPSYAMFDERRYFQSAEKSALFTIKQHKIAVCICEDMWQLSGRTLNGHYLQGQDPMPAIKALKPDLVVNLSASPYTFEKRSVRLQVAKNAASFLGCPFLLVNRVGSSDALLFDGHSILIDGNGNLVAQAQGFKEDWLISSYPFDAPAINPAIDSLSDLKEALLMGLGDYFKKSGFKKVCLGLSGGIDSALVCSLAVEALGAENVVGIAMPSRYSSASSLEDAKILAQKLQMSLETVSIEPIYQSYLDALAPHFGDKPFDVTEENLQARIRGALVMAFANKQGYLALSTGNKSEWAMGYSTLYGDLIGALSPIGDLFKHQVYKLARFIDRGRGAIPEHTFTRPPSAELRPDQKDSDSLPDYAIIDEVVRLYLSDKLTAEQIALALQVPISLVSELIHRLHQFEFKRRQAPFAFCLSNQAFSAGWKYPIVQHFA